MSDPIQFPPFTEARICEKIIAARTSGSLMLPRYTPIHWWECDVAEITAAGYLCEYEVKLSLSDFRVDAKKARAFGKYEFGKERPKETKHALLASGHEKGPRQFWYVAPRGLIPNGELPAWAGLIEVWWYSTGLSDRHPQIVTREVNPAPRLHGSKASDSVRHGLVLAGFWRYTYGQRARPCEFALPPEQPEELE